MGGDRGQAKVRRRPPERPRARLPPRGPLAPGPRPAEPSARALHTASCEGSNSKKILAGGGVAGVPPAPYFRREPAPPPMRVLLVVLLLLPATAQAQEAAPAERGPNRVVLALAGVGASTATLVAFGSASPDLAAAGLLLSPVSAAAAIHVVGQAQGGEDPFGRTLGSTALAMLPVFGLLAVTSVLFIGSAWDPDASDSTDTLTALGIVAGVSFLVLPSAYAAMRYRGAAPARVALVRTPDGGLAPVAGFVVSL